jgi:transcriptional regulator with XRE-family HTH domain
MYPNLKLQIFRRRGHQNQLAKDLGIDETVLSKIIHGYRRPTEAQRKKLSSYLEADESWLFESYEAMSSRPIPNDGQLAAEKKASTDGDI